MKYEFIYFYILTAQKKKLLNTTNIQHGVNKFL